MRSRSRAHSSPPEGGGSPETTPARASSKIRVLLADDSALMRLGMTALLESHPRLTVVSSAADGEQAVRQALELKPELVVIDYQMPGMNGLEAARRIKQRRPRTKVVLVTMHAVDAGRARDGAVDAVYSKMNIREQLDGLIESLFP